VTTTPTERAPLFEHITIHLTDALGTSSSITVAASKYFDVLRAVGARGMWSGDIPRGGIRLPYANADDFDWRLIGGREYTDRDGNPTVFARGHYWKRRELAANPNKNLRAMVKYSRGARPFDPPDIIEGDEGQSFRYVTLIVFAGDGHKDERYADPRRAAAS